MTMIPAKSCCGDGEASGISMKIYNQDSVPWIQSFKDFSKVINDLNKSGFNVTFLITVPQIYAHLQNQTPTSIFKQSQISFPFKGVQQTELRNDLVRHAGILPKR